MLNVKYWHVFNDIIFCLFAKYVIDLCELDLWPKKVCWWLNYEPLSILYKFQINISANSGMSRQKLRCWRDENWCLMCLKSGFMWLKVVLCGLRCGQKWFYEFKSSFVGLKVRHWHKYTESDTASLLTIVWWLATTNLWFRFWIEP